MSKTLDFMSKIEVELNEASYYTGTQTGQQAPETAKPYEFNKDAVPTLSKLADKKNNEAPAYEELLAFPLHDSVGHLADLYNKAAAYLSLCEQAKTLPLFAKKQDILEIYCNRMKYIMRICEKSAEDLPYFSLASK
jgi:hypothetical protein